MQEWGMRRGVVLASTRMSLKTQNLNYNDKDDYVNDYVNDGFVADDKKLKIVRENPYLLVKMKLLWCSRTIPVSKLVIVLWSTCEGCGIFSDYDDDDSPHFQVSRADTSSFTVIETQLSLCDGIMWKIIMKNTVNPGFGSLPFSSFKTLF
jgi:hypothetical protein